MIEKEILLPFDRGKGVEIVGKHWVNKTWDNPLVFFFYYFLDVELKRVLKVENERTLLSTLELMASWFNN